MACSSECVFFNYYFFVLWKKIFFDIPGFNGVNKIAKLNYARLFRNPVKPFRHMQFRLENVVKNITHDLCDTGAAL